MAVWRPQLAATAEQRETRLADLAKLGRSVITDVVPAYVGIVSHAFAFDEDLDRERAQPLIDGLKAACLVFGLPLLRTARMLAEVGHELAGEDPDDDPRALLPLVRTLGESYASLGSVSDVRELGLAFPAPPDSVARLLEDPRLNRWLTAQRRHGRLEPADGDRARAVT